MRQLAKDSRLAPDQVLDTAAKFFGPGGLGLEITHRHPDSLVFEGGGGMVSVQACPAHGGSAVSVDTREWEQPAERFLTEI
jgi:hypothetical protein